MNRNSTLRSCLMLFTLLLTLSVFSQREPLPQPAPETHETFRLGVAGYSFVHFDLDKTLETLRRLDVQHLCIKDFHLALDSSQEDIDAFHQKLASFGVHGYAVGPLYMQSEEEADRIFAYARRVGVPLIVGVPTYELLPYIEQKVREYDMLFAIHMHGPDQERFQDADMVWDQIRDLDERIGMCLDIGHDRRNGKDPVADLDTYHDRVFDIHLKDVTASTRSGYSVEVGRGILDIPGFVRMLRQVGYTGVVSLEHERNMDDPFMGIAESIGYFRGVLVATKR